MDVADLTEAVEPSVDDAVVADVRAQVEFYFGDTNLPTDKFLLKQIKKSGGPEGWCPIGVIASFPKLKKLLPGWKKKRAVALIVDALVDSQLLCCDDDGKRLRRINGVPEEWQNLDERRKRSVLVSNLGGSPTIESVEAAFAKFGTIVVVKIATQPRHVATVEFGGVESARAAVAAHGNAGGGWRRSGFVVKLAEGKMPRAKAKAKLSAAARGFAPSATAGPASGVALTEEQKAAQAEENARSMGWGTRFKPQAGRRKLALRRKGAAAAAAKGEAAAPPPPSQEEWMKYAAGPDEGGAIGFGAGRGRALAAGAAVEAAADPAVGRVPAAAAVAAVAAPGASAAGAGAEEADLYAMWMAEEEGG